VINKTLKNAYPVQVAEISKEECRFDTVDAIVGYIREAIDQHPVAIDLGVFDHYAHTTSFADHTIHEPILGATLVIFCFGKDLPSSEIPAVRPRSISVVEEKDRFIVSFLDAPNPQAHETMTKWVKSLRK
jgi:hypothetical protein